MKFLKEILSQQPQMPSNDVEQEDPNQMGQETDQDFSEEGDDENDLEQVADKATEDPDKQGLIRNVKGAHLVYKRETEDGTFEEMWCYNVKDSLKNEMTTRRAILSGTDIPAHKTSSDDGKQTYTIWTAGNVEILCIYNLPN